MTTRSDFLGLDAMVELSLAIGSSLDLQENCNRFLSVLARHMPIDAATVWVHCARLGRRDDGDCVEVYSLRGRTVPTPDITDRPELTNGSAATRYLTFPAEADGRSVCAICLGDIGAIVIESECGPICKEADFEQMREVFEKFATSLAGSIAHDRLVKEIEERTEVELELRSSKEQYRQLVESAGDMIYRTDLDGNVTYANPIALRRLGLNRNQVVGRSYSEFVAPKFVEEIEEFYGRQLEEGVRNTYSEILSLSSDGEEFWVGQSVQLVAGADGWIGFQAVARDITERKLTELELLDSRAKYRTLYNNMPTMYFTVDEHGAILSANPFAFNHLGYTEEDLIGQPVLKVFHPDDREKVLANATACLASRENAMWEFRKIKKSGEVIWVRESIRPVTDHRGRLALHIICEDITEQRVAEEGLRQSEARKSTILDVALDCVITMNSGGRIVDFNPAAETTFDYSEAEVAGRLFSELIVRPNVWQPISSPNGSSPHAVERRIELIGRRADGTEFPLEAAIVPLEIDDDQIIIAYLRDITERRHAEQELLEANRMAEQSLRTKERFLANMSHEMRTPLNVIIGMTHLLMDEGAELHRTRYLDAIKFSADNLLVLINDILEFAKIASGKLELVNRPFIFQELLSRITDTLGLQASEKGLSFAVDIDSALPEAVVGDEVRLNQVLLNLLTNAIKFTQNGGVSLRTRLESEEEKQIWVAFDVHDTGIGISTDEIDSIFDSFTQVNADTTRRHGGAGLGLAIVKELVERQGGTISVTSTPGSGSTFTVRIPFEAAGPGDVISPAPRLSSTDQASALEGARVLVAEDNELNQLVAKTMLEQWGAEVDVASNGMEAYSKASEVSYDAILMDIQMPGMDGFEVARKLRASGVTAAMTPIIALTASVLGDRRPDMESAGIQGFILKPFEPKFLLNTLLRYAGRGASAIPPSAGDGFVTSMPPTVSSADIEPYDLSYLDSNAFGDETFVARVVEGFLRQAPNLLAQLEDAHERQDWKSVGFLAHKMKSSAAVLGMKRISSALRTIESAAGRPSKRSAISDILSEVRSECDRAVVALRGTLPQA